MIYGYISKSTISQDLTAQRNRILESYQNVEFIECGIDEDALSSFMTKLGDDDKVVITDVLKLCSKNTKEKKTIFDTVIENYQKIFSTGAEIVVLDNPGLDSNIFKAAIINNHVKDSTAVEMAVSEILESQIKAYLDSKLNKSIERSVSIKNGIKKSVKRKGNPKGSKYNVSKARPLKEFILKNLIDFGGEMTNNDVMKETGLARNTFFKYKKELLQDYSSTPKLESSVSDRKIADVEELVDNTPKTTNKNDINFDTTEKAELSQEKTPEIDQDIEKELISADSAAPLVTQEKRPAEEGNDTVEKNKKMKNTKKNSSNDDSTGDIEKDQMSIFDFF